MREVKRKRALPVYIAAAVFALYALLFPLYALWHFLLAAVVTAAAWLIADALVKPRIEYVPAPEPAPVSFGADADAILAEASGFRAELERLSAGIQNGDVRQKLARLLSLNDKIAARAKDDGADLARIRKYQSCYPPTTLKLVDAYGRMESLGVEGENISDAMQKIARMLDSESDACEALLDSLYRSEAMDIDTDIQVMAKLMEREGLSGPSEMDEFVRRAVETEQLAAAEKAAAKAKAQAERAAREASAAEAEQRRADDFAKAEQQLREAARGEHDKNTPTIDERNRNHDR